MKIRTSFVTNSSSSSFVLLMDCADLDGLLKGLINEMIFRDPRYLKYDIKTWQEKIKDYKSKTKEEDTIFKWYSKQIPILKGYIKEAERILKRYEKSPKEARLAAAKLFLKEHNLTLKVRQGIVKISGGTSMWNGLTDMPTIIASIITYINIEDPKCIYSYEFNNTMDSE